MKYALLMFVLLFSAPAFAQSTATPIQLGTLQIVNGQAIWVPISSTNPLPVQLAIH